jgi:hypothetical protein
MNALAKAYMSTLVDPKNHMCRIPDSLPRKTSLFRSVATYDIPMSIASGSGSQRFSAALQPIIGDVSDPLTYQLAIVDGKSPTVTWDANTDWTAAANYVSDVGGTDPRMDINAPYLVNPPSQNFLGTFTALMPRAVVLTAPATTADVSVAIDPLSYRYTFRNSIPGNPGGISIPYGIWRVTVGHSFTPSATQSLVLSPSWDGSITSVDVLSQFATTVNATSAVATTSSISLLVRSSPGHSNLCLALVLPNTTTLGSAPSAAVSSVSLSNTAAGNVPFPSGNGVIEEIRPVACSLWASCNASGLLNGGEIAAAYVPKDYLESNYFSNTGSSYGNGQYYENLSKVEGAYNGKLKNGTYSWWSPEDMGSLQFQNVSESNNANWPALVVSGIFAPLNSITGDASGVVRLEVCTVFEYITKSTAFEQAALLGSQATIDKANQYLGRNGIIHSMPNDSHQSFINNLVSTMGNVASAALSNPGLVSGLASLALF